MNCQLNDECVVWSYDELDISGGNNCQLIRASNGKPPQFDEDDRHISGPKFCPGIQKPIPKHLKLLIMHQIGQKILFYQNYFTR